VSPVKYELGFYIPEDDILHSHCRENLKSYTVIVISTITQSNATATVTVQNLFDSNTTQ
jgi:hypothetical protein